jgi:hypothetical protein
MLIGVELVTEFVESAIYTGRLKPPHAPLSVLLIGAPEIGKTSIVSGKKSKAIAVFSDITGRGLIEACKLNPEISHFVLNDLVAIMSHRQTVNRYTQAMLNAITEEGIQGIGTPGGIENIQGGKRGVIACITLDLAQDGRNWWNKIGFASRLLPFAFSHSGSLTLRIKDQIDEGKNPKKPVKQEELRLPVKRIPVRFEEKFVRRVRKMADEKAKELGDPTGYRRLKQLRALACGHALRRSPRKPAVNEDDMEFLNKIFKFVSYSKLNPL